MDKQKAIEEMSRAICKSTANGCNFPTCSKCGIKDTCKALLYSTRAINAGFGNIKQFFNEFIVYIDGNDELKQKIDKFLLINGIA